MAQHLDAAAVSGEFVSDEQFAYAMKHGLPKTLDRFADEIISRSMVANNGTKTRVMTDLKISTRTLYSSLHRTAQDEK